MDSDVNFIGEPVNTDHLKSCSATVRSLGDAMGCLTMIIYSFFEGPVRSGQELWHELSTVCCWWFLTLVICQCHYHSLVVEIGSRHLSVVFYLLSAFVSVQCTDVHHILEFTYNCNHLSHASILQSLESECLAYRYLCPCRLSHAIPNHQVRKPTKQTYKLCSNDLVL